jgi:hypothetical protein
MALARLIGQKKPLFSAYTDFIETRPKNLEAGCNDAYGLHLVDLLAEHRSEDFNTSARIAESIGDR